MAIFKDLKVLIKNEAGNGEEVDYSKFVADSSTDTSTIQPPPTTEDTMHIEMTEERRAKIIKRFQIMMTVIEHAPPTHWAQTAENEYELQYLGDFHYVKITSLDAIAMLAASAREALHNDDDWAWKKGDVTNEFTVYYRDEYEEWNRSVENGQIGDIAFLSAYFWALIQKHEITLPEKVEAMLTDNIEEMPF